MSRTEERVNAFPLHTEAGRRNDEQQAEEDTPLSERQAEAPRRCKQVALFIALLGVKFWSELFGEHRSRLLVRVPPVEGKTLPSHSSASSLQPGTPMEGVVERAVPLAKLDKGFLDPDANVSDTRGPDGGKLSSELEQKPSREARLGSVADKGQDLSPWLREEASSSATGVRVKDNSKEALSAHNASILIALAYALASAKLYGKLHREEKAKVRLSPPSTAPPSPGGIRTYTQQLTILRPSEEEHFETTDSPMASPAGDVVDGPAWRFPEPSELDLALLPAALQGTGLPAVGGFLEQLIAASSMDLVLPADEAESESQTDGPSTQRKGRASRRHRAKRAHLRDKSAQVALLLALLGVRLFTDYASGKKVPLLNQVPAFFQKTLANLPDPLLNVIRYATGVRPPKGDLRAPRKKMTLPSPPFAKHKPKSHKTILHKQRLPSVDEVDARLSPSAKEGKKFLAQNVLLEADAPKRLSDAENKVIAAVASVLNGNSGEDLMGHVIEVENVNSLQSPRSDTPKSRSLKVLKFLGKGSSWAAFQAEDVDTEEELALRIFVMQKLQLSTDQTIELGMQALDQEERSARQACGSTDPLLVAGTPEVSSTGNFHVFSRVQLMELMEKDLDSLLEKHTRVPMEAKEYIAQRLLLQVLHLQEAKVSHTDLKLENCLLRKDGSFLLGDFGYSTPWGECMHDLSRLTLAYAEPELVIDFRGFLLQDDQVAPHPTSDLWSLGAVLFELFTDGELPYGMMEAHNNLDEMCNLAQSLLDREATSEELKPTLQEAKVPQRWGELILKLLEPQRTNRITGSEIVEKFPDLYGSSLD
ncbi:hypothetical protein ACSSS7_002033 [Eimeria intestinalis]